MSIELLIAIIAVFALIVAFFASVVARTVNKTEAANAEAAAGIAEKSAEPEQPDEPVAEEKAEEPAEEPVAEEKVDEPVAATAEEPAEPESLTIGDVDGKTKLTIKRVPFAEKLFAAPENVQGYFNGIYNAFVSYKKVHARISFKCASFRFGRGLLGKVFIKGKTMKLALALDVKDFREKTYFQKDMSDVKAYAEVPFTVKVKSDRAAKRAANLVDALAEKKGLVKKAKFTETDAIAEIKANAKK